MLKPLVWTWKVIKQYLGNCSIHGVRYLVDDKLSFLERIFWLISCAVSWWLCGRMIRNVVSEYYEHPVAVTAETMYLDWETPFPAIIFCVSTTAAMRSKYFKQNPGTFSNYSYPAAGTATVDDLVAAYEEMQIPCEEIMHRCWWNGVEFDCCTEFQVLYKTGIGHCWGINSQHLKKNGKSTMKYFMNRTVKYGDMIIDLIADKKTKSYFPKSFEAYVLNNLQIPIITTSEESRRMKLKADKMTRVEFIIQDTYNEEGVKGVPIERRNCRFPHEVLKNSYFDIYTSDSCNLQIMIEQMIKHCGCVNFFYFLPPGARICTMAEMQCLLAHKSDIVSFNAKECEPDCEGTFLWLYEPPSTYDLNRFEPSSHESPGKEYSRVHFTLLAHPTVRYRRYVNHALLDVIVSVGSAIGLFMGASILSIFELPYWLFIRRDRIS